MSDKNCTICNCDFSLEDEGGIEGDLGILPIFLCPTCFAGMDDLFDQLRNVHYEEEDMIDINDMIVVEYSREQDAFHIETISEMLGSNLLKVMSDEYMTDYVPLKICDTQEEADTFVKELEHINRQNNLMLGAGNPKKDKK